MKELIIKYQRFFDQSPLPVKSTVLTVILVLTLVIWYHSFWKNLHTSLITTNNEIATIKSSITELETRLIPLEKEIKTTSVSSSITLLPPYQTSKVLHSLLLTINNLTLLQLKNMPAIEASLPQSGSKVFEHGIMVKFSGDYFSTMRYLQAIEKLKWKIFWDKLEYKVTQYPLAEITLYVHTISNEGSWLNV